MKIFEVKDRETFERMLSGEGFDNEDVIVDINEADMDFADIIKLGGKGIDYRETSGKSFVLVTDRYGYDDIPEYISFAPTILEAKDIVEMDRLGRELVEDE